jgi:hypothetical protein
VFREVVDVVHGAAHVIRKMEKVYGICREKLK